MKISYFGLLVLGTSIVLITSFVTLMIINPIPVQNKRLPPYPVEKVTVQEPVVIPNKIPADYIETVKYPAAIDAAGVVWIDPEVRKNVSEGTFILHLDPYAEGYRQIPVKTYTIPLEDMDYAYDPLISYKEKFGCVTISTSGYWGYYIFTLPEGKKIDQGLQYSKCVEWISDHEVVIAENLYNQKGTEITYSIVDVNAVTKRIISSYDPYQ